MKISLLRTDASSQDFRDLVAGLDLYLSERYGHEQTFFTQYNQLDDIKHVVVAYINGEAVGGGAFKKYEGNVAEIKRMFASPAARGKGVATKVLAELEDWATEVGFKNCVLETLKMNDDAIGLYLKNGYEIIPNYGQYQHTESSVCMGKKMTTE